MSSQNLFMLSLVGLSGYPKELQTRGRFLVEKYVYNKNTLRHWIIIEFVWQLPNLLGGLSIAEQIRRSFRWKSHQLFYEVLKKPQDLLRRVHSQFDSGPRHRGLQRKIYGFWFKGGWLTCLTFLEGIDSECLLDFETLYFLGALRFMDLEAGLYLGSAGTFV